MLTLQPRWGGSYEEMWQFLKTCQEQHISAEHLRIFESEIYLDQAKAFRERDQKDKALPLYQKALSLLQGLDITQRLDALKGVIYSASFTKLEEYSREIDETLRLAPKESTILGYRGWIRFNQGHRAEGLKDYAMAAELGDAYSQLQYGKQLFYGVPSLLGSNQQQPVTWVKKSAGQGYEPAKQFLEQLSKIRQPLDVR
jgi:TPR repeat protein